MKIEIIVNHNDEVYRTVLNSDDINEINALIKLAQKRIKELLKQK